MGVLLNATADYAAASNSSKRFSTGEEAFDRGGISATYALVQCTPDLAPAACRSCLWDIIQEIDAQLSQREAEREVFLGAMQLSVRAVSFLLRQPYAAASGAGICWDPAAAAGHSGAGERYTPSERKSVEEKISNKDLCIRCLYHCLAPTLENATRGKCIIFDLSTLQEATENFSEENKLGASFHKNNLPLMLVCNFHRGEILSFLRKEGSLQGTLPDGQEVAVKKLSQGTGEGLNQLPNEVQVLAQLQHTKLVSLLGYCSHQNEVMLVYEYVKNGSLDNFLFDDSRGRKLNWDQRYNVIIGIAKAILYLHEDSSIRIVHRDLKSNNILLDENMNPKVADFGLARLLGVGHTQTKTTNVAGTYGYMAPEYAIFGSVSPKIDIFSFGVLVLEIVTGQRNNVPTIRTTQ